MKLFLDTNIIIDFLTARKPFGSDANTLFLLRKKLAVELMVSDVTIFNTAFSMHKLHYTTAEIFDYLTALLPLITITTMDRSIIDRSLQKRGKDFEDDAQYFSAIEAGADYIITRNKKDFPQEDNILEPKEFFDLMNIEY